MLPLQPLVPNREILLSRMLALERKYEARSADTTDTSAPPRAPGAASTADQLQACAVAAAAMATAEAMLTSSSQGRTVVLDIFAHRQLADMEDTVAKLMDGIGMLGLKSQPPPRELRERDLSSISVGGGSVKVVDIPMCEHDAREGAFSSEAFGEGGEQLQLDEGGGRQTIISRQLLEARELREAAEDQLAAAEESCRMLQARMEVWSHALSETQDAIADRAETDAARRSASRVGKSRGPGNVENGLRALAALVSDLRNEKRTLEQRAYDAEQRHRDTEGAYVSLSREREALLVRLSELEGVKERPGSGGATSIACSFAYTDSGTLESSEQQGASSENKERLRGIEESEAWTPRIGRPSSGRNAAPASVGASEGTLLPQQLFSYASRSNVTGCARTSPPTPAPAVSPPSGTRAPPACGGRPPGNITASGALCFSWEPVTVCRLIASPAAMQRAAVDAPPRILSASATTGASPARCKLSAPTTTATWAATRCQLSSWAPCAAAGAVRPQPRPQPQPPRACESPPPGVASAPTPPLRCALALPSGSVAAMPLQLAATAAATRLPPHERRCASAAVPVVAASASVAAPAEKTASAITALLSAAAPVATVARSASTAAIVADHVGGDQWPRLELCRGCVCGAYQKGCVCGGNRPRDSLERALEELQRAKSTAARLCECEEMARARLGQAV